MTNNYEEVKEFLSTSTTLTHLSQLRFRSLESTDRPAAAAATTAAPPVQDDIPIIELDDD